MRCGKGFFKRGLALVLALCMVITGLFVSSPTEAEAATKKTDEYTDLFGDYNQTDKTMVVKKGSYYFKLKRNEKNEYTVYISKKKNSGYKKISKCKTNSVVGNSKQMYFVAGKVTQSEESYTYKGGQALYRYVYKTGKTEKVTDLQVKYGEDRVEYVYGNKVCIGNSPIDGATGSVYTYNIKTKKKSKRVSCGSVFSGRGNYVLMQESTGGSDIEPHGAFGLWKLTGNGVKKIKTLTKNADNTGTGVKVIGNYVYYMTYPKDTSMHTLTFYRCKMDGTGMKKLGTVKSDTSKFPYKITSKYAVYVAQKSESGKYTSYYCKYTYATKKTTIIKKVVY